MKTYSRKRHQDYKIIEDVHELCRLCLIRVEETVPIFEQVDSACAALPMRIMYCVGYEISQEECLPNTICINCHQELQQYYRFRNKCMDSYLKLKSHLNATKFKDKIPEPILPEQNNINKENEELYGEYHKLPNEQVDEVERLVIADVYNIEDQSEFEKPMMAFNSVADSVNAVKEETTEIQVIEQSNEVNPDISTFLSAILVELGILVKNDQGLVVQDQDTSFELETGDDDHVIFELVEEDDEVDPDEEPIAFIIPEPTNHKKPEEMELQPLETVEIKPREMVEIQPLEMVENKPQKVMWINLEEIVQTKNKGKSKTRERKNVAGTKKTKGAWCPICGRTFASRSLALRHGAVHSGARPHVCSACGRAFAQKVVLERHRLVHEERRPYQCGRCEKSYTQRSALEMHERVHVAPHARTLQLHACTQCDKMFLYSSGLSRHMMTHKGRKFACGACDRLFNDKSSLTRHIRNAHLPNTPSARTE